MMSEETKKAEIIREKISEQTIASLKAFQLKHDVFSKGKLSLVIQFTRMVKEKDFPLKVSDFQTDSKGQVSGIGGANLKRILKDHGITRQLTSEGGRTSRGSMGLMMAYVTFLNQLHERQAVNLDEAENYWAEEVRQFFNNQPFILSADASKTIRANLDDLFDQAKRREQQNRGTRYLGVMLQHLVAAKLQMILPDGSFEIHGASVADAQTDRSGDFVINNTSIHCTTMPGDLLMEKCKSNISAGSRPVIITIYDRVHTAMTLVEDAGLAGRVEIWDIQQFLSSNVLEHSSFVDGSRNITLGDIINRYNKIVEEVETDPSLRIEFDAG